MPTKKFAVGAEVESYCTKCKLDRTHVIESLKSDGNINKVICRTCDGSHLFRRPKGDGTKPKKKKKSTSRKKKGAVTLTPAELAQAKPYSMTGSFETGDFIKHSMFGPGKVLELRAGKMEVGFEDGPKLLVCRTD